jgi:hypothetical protein
VFAPGCDGWSVAEILRRYRARRQVTGLQLGHVDEPARRHRGSIFDHMEWFGRTKDLVAIVVATVAVILSLITYSQGTVLKTARRTPI